MSKLHICSSNFYGYQIRNISDPLLPEVLKNACEDLAEHGLGLIKNGWIAGGAIRSRLAKDGASDLDCYFSKMEDLEETKNNILSKKTLDATIEIDDEYLTSLNTKIGKIDLVKTLQECPIDTLNSFDFTVCCFAMNTNRGVYYLESGLKHLEERKLFLHEVRTPFTTMLRLVKYGAKGYKMELEEGVKLAKMIKNGGSVDAQANKYRARRDFTGSG